MHRLALIGLASLMALACSRSSDPPARAATAAEHERMAEREERAAEAQELAAAQAAGPHASYQDAPAVARSSQQRANRHRELAARHRAAAKNLRAAEERECAGIAEEERASGPFLQRDNIVSVSTIVESSPPGFEVYNETRTSGARIVLRPTPHMTAEWLQHTVNCFIAKTISGPTTPEMASSPLALDGVDADVSSTGDGFAIEITAEDSDTVEEIIRRAEALEP
jgi:hypothetical protein